MINRVVGNIGYNINNMPFNSSMVNFAKGRFGKGVDKGDQDKILGALRSINNRVSFYYEGFFNDVQVGLSSLLDRQFGSILRNPDFNLLSANGTAPVTPVQGDDYQFLNKWFVNGAAGNNYTITPTSYASPSRSQTGSNYFLNVFANMLTSPLYLYNQNYSTTNQFNSMGQVNNRDVTFSAVIANQNATMPKVRFSMYLQDSGLDVKSGGVYLEPNALNLVQATIRVPDTSSTPYASSICQPRIYIEELGGGDLNIDIGYIKAEVSQFATDLDINHILEQLVCNALT